LLDEATAGLLDDEGQEFSRQVQRLADRGRTVLMATADIVRARETATRIGLLHHGRLTEVFYPDQITAIGSLPDLHNYGPAFS